MIGEGHSAAPYRNDLRRLTRAIGLALAGFGAALVIITAYTGWSANRAAVVRERQLIENALDDAVSRVLDEQKSIAWWDEAVLNIAGPRLNQEWADMEMGAFFSETYGHDEVFVLNAQNQPIYAYVDGENVPAAPAYALHASVIEEIVREARGGQRNLRTRARAFEEGQGNYRELLGAQNARWSAHVVAMDGRSAVVSAITIVPHTDSSLLRGTPFLLVSVVEIDAPFMSEVGSALLLPDLSLDRNPANGDRRVSESFVADDGRSLGYLAWTTKRPGQTQLLFILPLVIVGVAGAGGISAHMLRQLKRASGELAAREEQARYEAQHDALSGLANRHYFAEVTSERLERGARSGEGVAVAYIDVDRFKDINDTLGHHAGDELIKSVAARLSAHLGPNDFLARFGGDEFAVMRAPATLDLGDNLADQLRAAFAEPFTIYGQSIRMTASIGLAMAPDHGQTTEALMRCADIALYEAKKHGRDRAMFFCANMAWDVEYRRNIELALREALDGDELTLHYQPLVAAGSGKITGVEALLRWRHPKHGDISPAIFVPIAEEAGLMPALGAWVLDHALADSLRWPDLQVAINLSPVQFLHVDLEHLLSDLVAKHNVDPRRIVLEVTEGVLLESTERTRKTLDAIRAMGFKTALDDFGTGYSSLSYLCDFRFDKIKIDRAFVSGVSAGKQSMTVIQAVVTIGRGLGMDVVAEGVETEAEASILTLAGVNEIQGYFFSRPVPPDEIAPLAISFAKAAREHSQEEPARRRKLIRSVEQS